MASISEYAKHHFTVTPTPPFDFTLTAGYAVYFQGRYGTDTFENGIFRRLLDINGAPCLIDISSNGTVESPSLNLAVTGVDLDEDRMNGAGEIGMRLLGADQNLQPFYAMAEQDASIRPLIRGLYGLHLPQTAFVFEALVLAILGQQISSAVARKLRLSLIEKYGTSLVIDGTAYHAFPRPEALSEAGTEKLRAIGLSVRKAEYISDIARLVASGELDLENLRAFPDGDTIDTLTAIRGVGAWTAHWLLVRALNRPDGFPASDLALMRMVGILAGKGRPLTAKEAEEYSRRWSPYRSFVTGYLFAAARSGRMELITKGA